MQIQDTRTILRPLAAAVLFAFTAVGSPAFSPSVAVAAPAPETTRLSAASSAYLDQLLHEINARRASVGTPPVTYATDEANEAVEHYLADLTPYMLAYNSCFHGAHNPAAPGWDYGAESGLDGEMHGEVLACPDDEGFWTAPAIANGWWNSPIHFESLYGDPDVNTVACGTYGPLRGGRAFQTIACVTYRV